MKILFVASEADPFIKTGGLGDVMGALPKELVKLGAEVAVVLPKYSSIADKYTNELKFIKDFKVAVGWRQQHCGVFQYDFEGVKYYFIDNEYYFKREGIYGHYDDGERFAFFDRAVLESIKKVGFKPDIIHCNDWQTGLVPVLLKLEYSKDNFYKNIKCVYSIHNLLFKGTFDPNVLPDLLGYDMEAFNNGSLEFYGGVSFMKGGINYSDRIATVSHSYAREIQTPFYGEGMEGLLREKNSILYGILNGIDYDAYDPNTDQYILKNYNLETIEDKKINKKELQKELGLPEKEDVPIISIVSRLTNQKGIDLLIAIADKVLEKDVQLVILGTGDYHYQEYFENLHYRYPRKVSSNIKFNNSLAHKIYAGADMFLMPSIFEPCGLGQLIALRYGTIPIVRETGGLKDTVRPYNKYEETGNGFSFYGSTSTELYDRIYAAIECYRDKKVWGKLITEAMNSDNSWKKSSKEYINMYENLLS